MEITIYGITFLAKLIKVPSCAEVPLCASSRCTKGLASADTLEILDQ